MELEETVCTCVTVALCNWIITECCLNWLAFYSLMDVDMNSLKGNTFKLISQRTVLALK